MCMCESSLINNCYSKNVYTCQPSLFRRDSPYFFFGAVNFLLSPFSLHERERERDRNKLLSLFLFLTGYQVAM